jgi:transcriptional regulator GlxA family with amidase domain
LEQRFLTVLGTSPARHARELRLQKAARLTRDSVARFTDVSLQCGFASQAVFNRSFRERFGMSPRNYRRQHGTLIQPPIARK